MSLYIRKTRIFDIASGLNVSLDSATKLVTLRTNSLIKAAAADFRKNFVDSATPAFHIFDVKADITDKLKVLYPNIEAAAIEADISSELNKISTFISISELTTTISNITKTIQDDYSLALASNDSLSNIQLDNLYRKATIKIGQSLGQLFPKTGMLQVKDPETIGLAGKLVFIAKSFKNLRDSNLNKAINAVLKKYDIKEKSGDLTVLGHTAVEVSENKYRINTPLVTETLLRMEAAGVSRSAQQIKENDFVQRVPLFIKHKISFKENFSTTAASLLEFGFSFSVGMDPTENTISGSSYEKKARDAIISGIVMPELVETLKTRVSWLRDNAAASFKNSPTFLEFVTDAVVAALKGKKASNVRGGESKLSTKSARMTIPKVPVISKKANKVRAPKRAQIVAPAATSNLVSLLTLINSELTDRIKENMGEGNRRDILNLRTGRLAESAHVEHLSQSRAGMITAFYSYMKNPYATFSDGGKQQYPKSRDPKLLISKSIREIAATQVNNRMRAVLV